MHAFMPALGPRTLNFEAYCSTILRQIGKTTTARVPDSETVFQTFRAQEVEVNCVDPASKVGHIHSEQLSQRPNVDPSNIDEALGIRHLVN